MERQKLVIATPLYNSQGWGNYIRSLTKAVVVLESMKHSPKYDFDYEIWHTEGDSYVDNARNEIAKEFLKGDGTHLLFWDSDVNISAMGFARILKAPVEVVGAAFPVKNAWNTWPVLLSETLDGSICINKETGLYKAERIATGMLKIARSVFDKILRADPTNWYFNWQSQTMTYGFFNFLQVGKYLLREDYGFCERCKAVGVQIWCEARVDIGHMGVHEHLGNFHRAFEGK